MTRKVIIVGLGDHPETPFNDDGWEVWATAQHDDMNCTRFYQVHTGPGIPDNELGRDLPAPLYCYDRTHLLADELRDYPLQEAINLTQGYLECSIAYMLAHAILEGVSAIHLARIGCPFDAHHIYQRSNLEYLIGIARAKGITVTVQENSELLKSFWPDGRYGRCPQ